MHEPHGNASSVDCHVAAYCLREGAAAISECRSNGIDTSMFVDARAACIFNLLNRFHDDGTEVTLEALLAETERSDLEKMGGEVFLEKLARSEPTADEIRSALEEVASRPRNVSGPLTETIQSIQKILERPGLEGISTGFSHLDVILGGLRPQQMITIAGRPSMGKSALALNIVRAVVLPKKGQGVPALFLSLEASAETLTRRLICSRACVSMERLRGGFTNRDEQERLAQTAVELKSAPLYIDDGCEPTIEEIRARARSVVRTLGVKVIVVDYLQLIRPEDTSFPREQYIAEISRGLKAMARELDLPVIVLSQLNRESEKERRQPRLSDLRDSGAVEQDSDVVLLLARPRDAKDDFSVASDHVDLIVAKQRNGPVGECRLVFLREVTRFEQAGE